MIVTETVNALELGRNAQRERRRLLGLSYPTVILVSIVLVIPTLWLFWLSLVGTHGLTLVNYERMVVNSSYLEVFRLTFSITLLVTVVCVLLAYPLSYFICQLPRVPALLCLSIVVLPFWTSVLVRTYAWIVLLQSKGVINDVLIKFGLISQPLSLLYNVTGTAIGMTHIVLPFLVLPLYASMKSIDPNYTRAAASLGA